MHHHLRAVFLVLALAASLAAQTDWCSFFGRGGDDWILAMKTDEQGRIYVCGRTNVATHVTAGAYQPVIAGWYDAFVACVDPRAPAGSQLVWSTHLGGTGDEIALDLHVGPNGRWVTVVGGTTSTDFPTKAGWQMQHGGGIADGFAVRFDPAATGQAQLLWSTYLGASGADFAASVDEWNGMPTIAGTTESPDFPTHAAWQPHLAGRRDLFVCRLGSGNSPVFSTYLGGSLDEGSDSVGAVFGKRSVHVIADELGTVTVASHTRSIDYPNPSLRFHGPTGGLDLAITRFDPSGSSLLFSAVLGGTLDEVCHGLRADGQDRVVMVGRSSSPDCPTTPDRAQGLVDAEDGLVVHFDLARDRILYATYLGGTGLDAALTAYREPGGTFVVAGYSFAPDFPTTPGAPRRQRLMGPGGDGFLARLRSDGTSTATQYSTWFGGSVSQLVMAIEPDGQGGVLAAGITISPDFPLTNAFDPTFDGLREGWLGVHRLLPTAVTRFGHATSPCGRTTYLQTNRAPLAPDPGFAVETHDAPAAAPGAMGLGAPFPAGLALLNADLFLTAPVIVVPMLAGAQGYASRTLPLPVGFVWSGQLGLQSFWITPTSCGAGLLTASNALR